MSNRNRFKNEINDNKSKNLPSRSKNAKSLNEDDEIEILTVEVSSNLNDSKISNSMASTSSSWCTDNHPSNSDLKDFIHYNVDPGLMEQNCDGKCEISIQACNQEINHCRSDYYEAVKQCNHNLVVNAPDNSPSVIKGIDPQLLKRNKRSIDLLSNSSNQIIPSKKEAINDIKSNLIQYNEIQRTEDIKGDYLKFSGEDKASLKYPIIKRNSGYLDFSHSIMSYNTEENDEREFEGIRVGKKYQIPYLPKIFLLRKKLDPIDIVRKQRHDLHPEMVYSPYLLDKIKTKQMVAGNHDSVVKDDTEMTKFVSDCAAVWKELTSTIPFSSEYAYKILHKANYNPQMAIRLMNDSRFSIKVACDLPARRYDNKWKPKDRRGQIPTTPFPPPPLVYSRGYMTRRPNFRRI